MPRAAILLMLLVALPLPATAAGEAVSDWERAREVAVREQRPVLVEFRAPWCYSCYFMATHVHTGAAWAALLQRVVLLELDADSPHGAERMDHWKVKALPSYLLLDADGTERGRVLGEQTREAFYAAIEALLDEGGGLEALRAGVEAGGRPAADLAAVLDGYRDRAEAGAGLDWFAALPGPVRAQSRDPVAQRALARLRLQQAADGDDGAACLRSGGAALAADPGCQRPYLLRQVLACADADDGVDPAVLADWLRAQHGALQELVARRVLGSGPACADQRSPVFVLAEVRQRLGELQAWFDGLQAAARHYRSRFGDDPANDRAAADNLRVTLEALDRREDYAALLEQLIARWPDEYVYPYRYGRHLLDRGDPEAALPYLAQAAAHAYGENRLRVAELRVRALVELGRDGEARRVATQALRANGPWFPDRVAAVKAALEP